MSETARNERVLAYVEAIQKLFPEGESPAQVLTSMTAALCYTLIDYGLSFEDGVEGLRQVWPNSRKSS